MTTSLVSVVIPAHNAVQTIGQTLDSILCQTYQDIEVIVVANDCSDKTVAVVKTKSAYYGRDIKLLVTSLANPSVARTLGQNMATGEYIAYCDADDIWHPDKIRRQVETLEEFPEVVLSYCYADFVDEQGKLLFKQKPCYHRDSLKPLMESNFIVCGSIPVIRTSTVKEVGDWDPDYISCQDWDYWIRVAQKGPFMFVPHHLVSYRQSSHSLSADIEQRLRYNIRLVDKIYEEPSAQYKQRKEYTSKELQNLKPVTLANIYKHVAKLYLDKRNNPLQATSKLLTAVGVRPTTVLQSDFYWLLGKILRSVGLSFISLINFLYKTNIQYYQRRKERD